MPAAAAVLLHHVDLRSFFIQEKIYSRPLPHSLAMAQEEVSPADDIVVWLFIVLSRSVLASFLRYYKSTHNFDILANTQSLSLTQISLYICLPRQSNPRLWIVPNFAEPRLRNALLWKDLKPKPQKPRCVNIPISLKRKNLSHIPQTLSKPLVHTFNYEF